MRYYVQRGNEEAGPFTLGSLRRRVDRGEVFLSDQVRSLDSPSWMPLGQFFATVATPAAAHSADIPSDGRAPALPGDATPPDLHWAIIMVLGPLTFSVFPAIWGIVQTTWVRRIRPQSKALFLLLLAIGAGLLARALYAKLHDPWMAPVFSLASFVLLCCAEVAMARDLEAYYNTTENIHLKLSGAMVFFFNVLYFQYHLSRIARWKKTGILSS